MKHFAQRLHSVLLSIAICWDAAAAQATPKIPIEYYDLSEISLVRTKPSPTGGGGSAVFRDPTGQEHRIKAHRSVATNRLVLANVKAGGVTLGRVVQCMPNDWCLMSLYEWKINAMPVPLPIPTWASEENPDLLDPKEWPVTVEGAVRMIISGLPDDEKLKIRNTKKDDLALFHHGWGTGIRNYYGLWRGNNKLILSACGKPCHPDSASVYIVHAVWAELQK